MLRTFGLIAGINIMVGVSVAAAMYTGAMWAFNPYAKQQIRAVNAPRPGDALYLEINVDRLRACPSRLYREVYDGEGRLVQRFNWQQGARRTGRETRIISVEIPKTAAPGKRAQYCWAQKNECNVMQALFGMWGPIACESFQITPP